MTSISLSKTQKTVMKAVWQEGCYLKVSLLSGKIIQDQYHPLAVTSGDLFIFHSRNTPSPLLGECV